MRYSNNISAELIGLAAARKLTGRTVTLPESTRILTEWLEVHMPKINWRGFHLENQSGFSSKSRVTPRQIVGVLASCAQDGMLFDVLPPVFNNGSTVTTAATPPRAPVIGKGGTMEYAVGLAGYLPSRDGRRLAFAIFIFDRRQRAALDATIDRRIVEPSPLAREWINRARTLAHAMLQQWVLEW
jgi:D-alanyl-D-alanine carboxypeptidase/D-alanyl-D-alanine-endopeptidase (penicillin-binding protein 4)